MNIIIFLIKLVLKLILAAIVTVTIALFIWAPGFIFSRVNSVELDTTVQVSQSALTLHDSLFIADLHDDSLAWRNDLLKRNHDGHSDLVRLRQGSVDLVVYSAITKSMMSPGPQNDGSSIVTNVQSILQTQPPSTWFSPFGRALFQASKLKKFESRSEDMLMVLNSEARLRQRLQSNSSEEPIGAILSVEGLHALEGDIENFDRLYDAGYRIFGMAHFFDNAFAGSAQGMTQHGLTALGRELIEESNQRNLIWDLAHASNETMSDVLALSANPVVVSHTGVKAVCEKERNLSDQQIQMVAEHGGLIGIGFWKSAMCENSVNAIVRSIRHVVDLVGIDHVALGSDFNGSVTTPFDASGLALLTQALLDDGFSEYEIRAIMGENVRALLLENATS